VGFRRIGGGGGAWVFLPCAALEDATFGDLCVALPADSRLGFTDLATRCPVRDFADDFEGSFFPLGLEAGLFIRLSPEEGNLKITPAQKFLIKAFYL